MIQPILIAFNFQKETIFKAKGSDFNTRGIKLFSYKVISKDKIKFTEVI